MSKVTYMYKKRPVKEAYEAYKRSLSIKEAYLRAVRVDCRCGT